MKAIISCPLILGSFLYHSGIYRHMYSLQDRFLSPDNICPFKAGTSKAASGSAGSPGVKLYRILGEGSLILEKQMLLGLEPLLSLDLLCLEFEGGQEKARGACAVGPAWPVWAWCSAATPGSRPGPGWPC